MSIDPLSLLGDLPDWPGTTPPKNRGGKKERVGLDKYNGARPVIYKINGVDKPMFTVGQLAQALGRKAITIRSWEHKGWLPKSTYRTPPPEGPQLPNAPSKGRRLYSIEQLEFLLEATKVYKIDDPTHPDWAGFRNHIRNNWPRA